MQLNTKARRKVSEPANGEETEMQKLRTSYDIKTILELHFPMWEIKKPMCVFVRPYREAERINK